MVSLSTGGCNNARHPSCRHNSSPVVQLPGTLVGRPCKKAWLSSVNSPRRNSFWTCVNHASRVRSQVVSSVMPCIPASEPPHIKVCPWKAVACLEAFIPARRSHGTSAKKVPLGGGSWYTSPARMTFKPPKGWISPFLYLATLRSRMSSRQRISSWASSSALTMLNSSIINQRSCVVFWASSSNRAKLSPLLLFQASPSAWWMVSPSNNSAMTAWKLTIWNCTPCCHPSVCSKDFGGETSGHAICRCRARRAGPNGAAGRLGQEFRHRAGRRMLGSVLRLSNTPNFRGYQNRLPLLTVSVF